ncbi:MAG: DUF2189 domain-containing protein [Rhodocyclaceae bacterium]|nr:DUF2189 domain-containing protein [Rhodocyclaceae bacterium]MCB1963179.1 DUF2189 domain-containing protein [Rhodocyclaceae bacterium]
MSVHGVPQRIPVATIGAVIRAGWRDFQGLMAVSMGFSASFVVTGLIMITVLVESGLAPMVTPLVGGFMIFGPVALAGFFALREARLAGRPVSLGVAYGAMRNAIRPVWVMGVFCVFIVLIWLTDAGTLYSFMVGDRHATWLSIIPTTSQLLRFHFGAAIMGGGLALIVYVVTVHAVPLLIRGQGTLVSAVSASVRAVGRSLAAHLLWAVVLAVTVMAGIFLLPALLIVLPVMAYASAHWTEAVFPSANPAP